MSHLSIAELHRVIQLLVGWDVEHRTVFASTGVRPGALMMQMVGAFADDAVSAVMRSRAARTQRLNGTYLNSMFSVI
jgi:hypothetical protein